MDSAEDQLWDMAAETIELHNTALARLTAWNEQLEARIESLEQQCQCNGPPLSERVGALEAWQKQIMLAPYRQCLAVKSEYFEAEDD